MRKNGSVSLFAFGPSRGPSWQIGLQAGASMVLPIVVMTILGNPQLGYIAGSGAFVALFGRAFPVAERARVLVFVTAGLIVSGVLGVAVAHSPVLVNVGIVVVAIVAAGLCFGYRIGVPGPLFFMITFGLSATVMRAAPIAPSMYVLAFVAGCVFAYLVTLAPLVRAADRAVTARPIRELLPGPAWDTDARMLVLRVAIVAVLGVLIGTFLDTDRAYWIAGAAIAVIGLTADRRVAMQRALHRVLGTIVGAGVYVLLSLLHPSGILLALLLGVLQFLIELVVARHYALALTMITPLVLLLVGAATGSIGDLGVAMERVIDTLVGAALGGLSGLLHPRAAPVREP